MQLDLDYINKQLGKMLSIPSPTGNTGEIIDYLDEEIKTFGLVTWRTNKNALIATLEGKDTSKAITVSAHVDTLGAMVKEIKGNGRLKISQLGGYAWDTIEGEYCEIETMEGNKFTGTVLTNKASVHVHGGETSSNPRDENTIEIRLDKNVRKEQDVLDLGISVGDFVSFDPRTKFTDSGYIKSRHLDDKAGVVAILGIIKYLKDENITPNNTIHFFFSNYEEVGHGASASIPKDTVDFLAIDMAAPGEGQLSDEHKVTICAKDSTGPYDYEFRKELVTLARDNKLSYAVDIYPSYGSDASAALRAGHDIRAALIGPGVDASHSFERTHIEGIENTIKLALLYLTK